MASLDPRTPVIVGAGQTNGSGTVEPIDLMVRCSEAAFDGTGRLRSACDWVRVVWGVWPYRDPGRLVADRLGIADARTTLSTIGGNQVYDLVNDSAARIARGDADCVVIAAAETQRQRRSDRARGERSTYLDEPDDAAPDETFGITLPLNTDTERAAGLDVVARFYAMAETALRHRLGENPDDHLRRISVLWARAAAIAADNPAAWSRDAPTAERIATPDETNRPVSSPYTKLLTANLHVDQGGALVVTSAGVADAAGVPRDRWVFPWAGSGANDHWYPTNRWAFDESPAIAAVGRDVLARAGVSIDECALVDLYSCFPVAVEVAQRELGISPDRDFTITGGLTFAAGPLNCYGILALTRAVDLLRERPGDRALLTGNGGCFSKHAAIVLGNDPPRARYTLGGPHEEIDRLPARPDPSGPVASATLETYTVTSTRDMVHETAIAACLDADGRRHWATSTDPALMADLAAHDRCGVEIALRDGEFAIS